MTVVKGSQGTRERTCGLKTILPIRTTQRKCQEDVPLCRTQIPEFKIVLSGCFCVVNVMRQPSLRVPQHSRVFYVPSEGPPPRETDRLGHFFSVVDPLPSLFPTSPVVHVSGLPPPRRVHTPRHLKTPGVTFTPTLHSSVVTLSDLRPRPPFSSEEHPVRRQSSEPKESTV